MNRKLSPLDQDALLTIYETQDLPGVNAYGIDPYDLAHSLDIPQEVTEISLIALHQNGLIIIDPVPDVDEPMGAVRLAPGVDSRIQAELTILRDRNWLDDLGRPATESSHNWLIRDAHLRISQQKEVAANRSKEADDAKLAARALVLKEHIAATRRLHSRPGPCNFSLAQPWHPQVGAVAAGV